MLQEIPDSSKFDCLPMFDRSLHTLVNTLDRSVPAWVKKRIKNANPQFVDAVYRQIARRTSDRPVEVTIQDGPLARRRIVCSLKHQRSCFLGNFEPWKSEVLQSALKPGTVFFDVGAHIGYFSLMAAQAVRPNGQVVAFEPEPKNVQQFRENLKLNPDLAASIRLEEVAVSDTTAVERFERGSNSYVGHLALTGVSDTIEVSTTTVDAFVAASRLRPDFIKIDVEGAESRVFDGMSETLTQCRPVLLIEIHGASGAQAFSSLLERYRYTSRQVQVSSEAEAAGVGWDALSEVVATPQ